MHNNDEAVRLLRSIRNMVFGVGFMVFAIGLFAFGYAFTQGTSVFVAIFYISVFLFLMGAVWWIGSRRLSDPVNDPHS